MKKTVLGSGRSGVKGNESPPLNALTRGKGGAAAYLKKNGVYYLLLLPVVVYFAIFAYAPMYGIIIAWKRFSPALGILGSKWVGWIYFEQFFSSMYFGRILKNTLLISFYDILFGFPLPIIFAILLNELRSRKFMKVIQTVSYMPYFISIVIICGMLKDFLGNDGIITTFLSYFGMPIKAWLQDPAAYRLIYVASGIWQNLGFSAVVFLAAISGVDTQLYDAAYIDGCSTVRRIFHVTLPAIVPTIVIMFILRIGSVLGIGAEKTLLLYSPTTYVTGDIISSFVYRYGLLNQNYSYGTAVGIFNSVVNIVLLTGTNFLSRKLTETSLW